MSGGGSYLVTAQHATAVSLSETGNFTAETDLNLLIARSNRIEIQCITPEGLRSIKEIAINGTIEVMKLFRPQGLDKDRLFVMTAKYNAMILEVEGSGSELEIVTKAYGDVSDQIGKKSETGIIACIDPESRVIGLRLYDSLFKVIPLDRGQTEIRAFNIRMEEITIHDIKFLHGCQQPTIVLIHADAHGRHVKTHELSLKNSEFDKVAWKQDNVERLATLLIPVPEPMGGVLIIGAESITYHSGHNYETIAPPAIQNSSIVAYTKIDSTKFLLGDMDGHLFLLLLQKDDKNKSSQVTMNLELLGETSIPETINYLDNGYLYIGSMLGNSQLIKLMDKPDEQDNFVEVVDNFMNLGPILDMIVVDLEKQGQGQLVTCSGGYKDGSLRIIRNGIGIHELASIDELPANTIKGMWPLRVGSKLDNTLVLSFVEETVILSIVGFQVEQTTIPGFDSGVQTFYAGNTDFDQIIQVTSEGVRLVSSESKEVVDEWKPPGGKHISVCGTNSSQILVACGSVIFYLEVQPSKLKLCGDTTLEHEVACIDLTPYDGETRTEVACLGLWTDISVRIIRIPSLEEVTREYIGGEIIPRSILLTKFEGVDYLLCSLGDGALFYFLLTSQGTLVDKRKVILGTQPTVLRKFRTHSTTNVFVCSDRPTVIYSSNKKLVFANVNLKEVKHMCSLNTEAFRDCLALTSDTITIGTIDEIQKLHIRSVPLGEAPCRIAYQEATETFGVLTKRVDIMDRGGLKPSRDSVTTQAISSSIASTQTGIKIPAGAAVSYGDEVDVYSFIIVDQNTFEVVHAHSFLQNEYALSLTSCKLGEDDTVYYVVGTGIVLPEEPEPKVGRLVIFTWADGKLTQVAEKETKGGVWQVEAFNGKLVSSVNSTVRLWDWTHEKELRLECSHFNHIMTLFLKVSGDFILVGDLINSLSLLQYKAMENSLEDISKDYSPNWMTAIEIIDEEKFLGMEKDLNLFICQRDSGANTEEERMQMTEVGQIHLGEWVNVFRHGSLVMQNLGDNTVPHSGSILLGTVHGSIKLITQLPQDLYDMLNELQNRLAKTIKSVGRVSHFSYRQFSSEKERNGTFQGFIDGDVIESFLDLERPVMEEVCAGMMRTSPAGDKTHVALEDAMKIVEDLTRIH